MTTTTTSKMTLIRNTFHNSAARTRLSRRELEAARARVFCGEADTAEKARVSRINNALCGCKGCECGTGFETYETLD